MSHRRIIEESEDLSHQESLEFSKFVMNFEDVIGPLWSISQSMTDEDIFDVQRRLARVFPSVQPQFHGAFRRFLDEGSLEGLNPDTRDGEQLVKTWRQLNGREDPFFRELQDAVEEKLELHRRVKEFPAEHPADMEDPIYGKFIFAPERSGKVPPERNTPREDSAYRNLRGHVRDNKPIDQDVALDLMGALEAGAYEKVIHEPEEEFAYRGMEMRLEELASFIGASKREVSDEPSGSQIIDSMKSTSKKEGSSSWSIDIESALGFSGAPKGDYSVVLVARVRDNPDTFIVGPGGFYDVHGLDQHHREKEAIALGPVKVHKIYWKLSDGVDRRVSADDVVEMNTVKERISVLRRWIRECVLVEMNSRESFLLE